MDFKKLSQRIEEDRKTRREVVVSINLAFDTGMELELAKDAITHFLNGYSKPASNFIVTLLRVLNAHTWDLKGVEVKE